MPLEFTQTLHLLHSGQLFRYYSTPEGFSLLKVSRNAVSDPILLAERQLYIDLRGCPHVAPLTGWGRLSDGSNANSFLQLEPQSNFRHVVPAQTKQGCLQLLQKTIRGLACLDNRGIAFLNLCIECLYLTAENQVMFVNLSGSTLENGFLPVRHRLQLRARQNLPPEQDVSLSAGNVQFVSLSSFYLNFNTSLFTFQDGRSLLYVCCSIFRSLMPIEGGDDYYSMCYEIFIRRMTVSFPQRSTLQTSLDSFAFYDSAQQLRYICGLRQSLENQLSRIRDYNTLMELLKHHRDMVVAVSVDRYAQHQAHWRAPHVPWDWRIYFTTNNSLRAQLHRGTNFQDYGSTFSELVRFLRNWISHPRVGNTSDEVVAEEIRVNFPWLIPLSVGAVSRLPFAVII